MKVEIESRVEHSIRIVPESGLWTRIIYNMNFGNSCRVSCEKDYKQNKLTLRYYKASNGMKKYNIKIKIPA